MNALDFVPGIVTEAIGVIILVIGLLDGSPAIILLGAALIGLSIILLAGQIIHHAGAARAPAGSEHLTAGGILYADNLVTLTGDSITFHHYFFPLFTEGRTVLFQDIDRIEIRKPTILNGKWRIGGSGNLSTWFPFDWHRPSRDRIFVAVVREQGMNVGFTVGNPAAVTAILRKKGIPVSDEFAIPG